MKIYRPWLALLSAFLPVFALSACRSPHVDITVDNRTGTPVRLLEIDYPRASFGADNLDAGKVMHYRIQVQGQGLIKVQYTGADGRQVQFDGPQLAEGDSGNLEIELQPAGKPIFRPQFQGASRN